MNNILIRPILFLPTMIMDKGITQAIVLFLLHISFVLSVVFVLNKYTLRKWEIKLNIIVPTIAVYILFFASSFGMATIKGVFLFALLYLASISDIKTRKVSNVYPLCIFITAFINIDGRDIPSMLLAMILLSLPQLIIAMMKVGCYGGADIKIMASCSFLLGFRGGFIALVTGLSIGIITTLILRKIKNDKENKGFPLVPYLAIGSYISYIIILGGF